MIKEIKEKLMIEKSVVVEKVITCDCCKNNIVNIKGDDANKYHGISYYELTTGHHDWGNDSLESIETSQLCSDYCLVKSIADFLEKEKNSNTKYFESQTCSC